MLSTTSSCVRAQYACPRATVLGLVLVLLVRASAGVGRLLRVAVLLIAALLVAVLLIAVLLIAVLETMLLITVLLQCVPWT